MATTKTTKRPGKRDPLEHWELEALARDLVDRGLATTGILEIDPTHQRRIRDQRRKERRQREQVTK